MKQEEWLRYDTLSDCFEDLGDRSLLQSYQTVGSSREKLLVHPHLTVVEYVDTPVGCLFNVKNW